MPENVRFLSAKRPETVLIDDLGVAIHGQGFAQRAVREDLLPSYPPACKGLFNIGILHTAATGREGHEPYAPCNVEGLLAKEYDYWALGHVHRREILYENPWMVFPGNIQGRHVNESGPRMHTGNGRGWPLLIGRTSQRTRGRMGPVRCRCFRDEFARGRSGAHTVVS